MKQCPYCKDWWKPLDTSKQVFEDIQLLSEYEAHMFRYHPSHKELSQ